MFNRNYKNHNFVPSNLILGDDNWAYEFFKCIKCNCEVSYHIEYKILYKRQLGPDIIFNLPCLTENE